jgi:5-formyltetrahydrofolate cyclo-ligase
MKKEALRIHFKKKRSELTDQMKLKIDDLLLIQFQKLLIDIPSNIMSYLIKEDSNEFDPQYIIDYCSFKNLDLTTSFPVMLKDFHSAEMIAVDAASSSTFITNAYGIPEPKDGNEISPEQLDLVIVPLLCFDQLGNRVGYGKGYYDRFLKKCRKDCIKIGFSYFSPIERIEDINEFDVPLDYGISPDAIHEFH